MHILSERQAVGIEERDALHGQLVHQTQDALEGLLDAEHVSDSRVRVLTLHMLVLMPGVLVVMRMLVLCHG